MMGSVFFFSSLFGDLSTGQCCISYDVICDHSTSNKCQDLFITDGEVGDDDDDDDNYDD